MIAITFLASIILAALDMSNGARILAFLPFPMKSHNNLFRPIVEGLAARGHQVTYVTSRPINPHPNIKQVVVQNVLDNVLTNLNVLEMEKFSSPRISNTMASMGLAFGEALYPLKEIQEIIHTNEKYDLLILESFFMQEPQAAFIHKFGVPAVDIVPLGECAWVNEFSGLPDNPAYMIDFKIPYTDDMTFLDRLHNTYVTWTTTLINYYNLKYYQEQMDKYFKYEGWENRPAISKLVANKSLILLNSHPSTGYSFPRAPHVKEIGGIHIGENKPLPKDIQTFMDGAKDGVIFFSLGSNLNISKMAASNMQNDLTNVFGSLKQRVIWKWDSDSPPKVSANVMVGKWFPQQDILAHKNMKLFITHGGYLSISESIYHGVPLIGTPFFSDQHKNMKHVSSAGYGVTINKNNITEVSMKWAINEILDNPKYKTETLRRSALFKDRPMKPVEEAIYWLEYVIKHGNALQPRSVHLSFFTLHMLDVIAAVFVALVILFKLTKCLFCKLLGKSTKNGKSKKD